MAAGAGMPEDDDDDEFFDPAQCARQRAPGQGTGVAVDGAGSDASDVDGVDMGDADNEEEEDAGQEEGAGLQSGRDRSRFYQERAAYNRRRREEAAAKATSTAQVTYGYVVELVRSKRYEGLEASRRVVIASRCVLHYTTHLAVHGALPEEPPTIRLQARGAAVAESDGFHAKVCRGGDQCTHHGTCRSAAATASATGVLSRGRRRHPMQ